MSVTDELLASNASYASSFELGGLPIEPRRRIAIVTCMDARIDPAAVLGLAPGDAHVIRNAGGVVTPHEIRALAISQRVLGTREIVVIRHTSCGVIGFDDAAFADELEAESGSRPPWPAVAFENLEEDLRASVAELAASPFLDNDSVRGFVYDIETGKLHEVT